MEKIGFFGGSFNPPTIAHLKIVETALEEFGLNKLVIVPMGDKYEKSELLSFDIRYEMLKNAFKGNKKIVISDMQKNQLKKSYAIDTFKKINEKYNSTKNFFIMGLDNYTNISNWKCADELTNNYNYIVFKRDNIEVPKISKNVCYLDVSYNVSSTDARNKIKNNESAENILSKEVIDFINDNKLYKEIK